MNLSMYRRFYHCPLLFQILLSFQFEANSMPFSMVLWCTSMQNCAKISFTTSILFNDITDLPTHFPILFTSIFCDRNWLENMYRPLITFLLDVFVVSFIVEYDYYCWFIKFHVFAVVGSPHNKCTSSIMRNLLTSSHFPV